MNITNKKILNIVTLCILLIVPFLKFFSMNLELFKVIRNYDFINPALVLFISVPFLIYIYIKDIKDKKRKLDIYDYIFYILILVGLISVVFSINKNLAIFGTSYRHEGFLSILSYYLLFINWKVNGTKEDIRKYIKLLVIIAIINSIYALLQMYTEFDFILTYYDNGKMASGMCGNPNFFGSMIVTVLGILTSKFLIKEKVSIKEILIFILLFISLINSQSSGPILTYIITLIFLIIFILVKKVIILKKLIILLLVLPVTYISIMYANQIYKSNNIKCETCAKSIKETIDSGGNSRLMIWGISLDIIKDNPIVGVGYDNFELAYPNPKVESGIKLSFTNDKLKTEKKEEVMIIDNAHNIYLHTLVTTGFLGLIPYLLVCLMTFIKGLKSKDELSIILLGGFIAYSVQGFANISVIQVAPIYYLIIGLILSINKEQI